MNCEHCNKNKAEALRAIIKLKLCPECLNRDDLEFYKEVLEEASAINNYLRHCKKMKEEAEAKHVRNTN